MNDTDKTEEFDETEQTVECPFCGAAYGCEHELLVVDESEPFGNLLEEVEALADESTEVDQEGGPGQSSEIVIYWAKNVKDQLARFNASD
jgi:hypothetical protein